MLESAKGKFRQQIHVAILDTGIDLNDPFLQSRISASDCWDFVENTALIRDEVGHGTHTASILARTAPRARIFCGRVWKRRSEEKGTDNVGELVATVSRLKASGDSLMTFTKTSAQALEHAVDKWKADIIVMPFAFPYTVDQIDDAIDKHHSRALLFAATSNQNDEEVGFPARHGNVIGIYSNKSHSVQSEFCKLGKEQRFNFSAIGEGVDGSWPQGMANGDDTGTPGRKKQSGTSCSTPIAAGIAAMILEFASLAGRVQVDRAAKLKKKEVMEWVLFDCMTDKHMSGTYNLLQPWKLLGLSDGKLRRLQPIADMISRSIKESGG